MNIFGENFELKPWKDSGVEHSEDFKNHQKEKLQSNQNIYLMVKVLHAINALFTSPNK